MSFSPPPPYPAYQPPVSTETVILTNIIQQLTEWDTDQFINTDYQASARNRRLGEVNMALRIIKALQDHYGFEVKLSDELYDDDFSDADAAG